MLTDTKGGEVEGLLREGQEAAKRGDVESARSFLTQVVERDPNNEQAWMWLSGVVEDAAEQQICLENVLVINPDNTKARQGLEYLRSQLSATAEAEPAAPVYEPEYTPSPSGEMATPQGDMQLNESPALEPAETAPAWEESTPVETFDISGLELQTAPTLEGSLPWLQNLGHPANANGNGNGVPQEQAMPSFEPPMAAQPFDPSTMFTSPPEPQQVDSTLHETSFAGVADNNPPPVGGQGGVTPFGPGQEGLPVFDFSSLSQSAEPSQGPTQEGTDFTVDFGDAPFRFEEHVAAQAAAEGAPASEFMELPAGGFHEMVKGPMGPLSEVNLPAPSELPGYKGETSDWSQPWYVENSDQPPPAKVDEPVGVPLYSSGLHSEQVSKDPTAARGGAVRMISCPNCREQVADTALACPKCHFNFFINCPNCHELVDTSETAPAKAEHCPHCNVPLDLMKLGQSGVDGAAQYQSTKLSSVGASTLLATSLDGDPRPRKRLSFGWVIDVVWLATIIVIIWALTQLPTWLHLTGQY